MNLTTTVSYRYYLYKPVSVSNVHGIISYLEVILIIENFTHKPPKPHYLTSYYINAICTSLLVYRKGQSDTVNGRVYDRMTAVDLSVCREGSEDVL